MSRFAMVLHSLASTGGTTERTNSTILIYSVTAGREVQWWLVSAERKRKMNFG